MSVLFKRGLAKTKARTTAVECRVGARISLGLNLDFPVTHIAPLLVATKSC